MSPSSEQEILLRFFSRWLPPVDSLHRNAGNEVRYILTTLSRLLPQFLGVKPSKEAMLQLLYNEGYTVFNRFHILFETTLGATEKTMGNLFDRPTQTNRSKKSDALLAETQERVHVNVDGNAVKALRSLTLPLPENTSTEKRAEREALRSALSTWCENLKESLPGGI